MAERKGYIFGFGPFFYDDEADIEDQDGDFAGEQHAALVVQGQMRVEAAPSEPTNVLRMQDLGGLELAAVQVTNIDNPTELNALSGNASTMLMAYQVQAGANLWTLYSWDTDGTVDSPWVIEGSSGYWVAIGGRYHRGVHRIGQGSGYAEISATGLITMSGTGGLRFGSASAYETSTVITVAAPGTWYEVSTGLTGGEERGCTFQNSHEIKVLAAGHYLINWSMSLATSGVGDELMGAVGVNGAVSTVSAAHGTVSNTNAHINVGGSAVLNLAANDLISLFVQNESAARDINIEHATLTCLLIGG